MPKSKMAFIPVGGQTLKDIRWLGRLFAREHDLEQWQGEAVAIEFALKLQGGQV